MEAVLQLLQLGAPAEARNRDGLTALDTAGAYSEGCVGAAAAAAHVLAHALTGARSSSSVRAGDVAVRRALCEARPALRTLVLFHSHCLEHVPAMKVRPSVTRQCSVHRVSAALPPPPLRATPAPR